MYVSNTNRMHFATEVTLQHEHLSGSYTAVFVYSTSYAKAPQFYVMHTLPFLFNRGVNSPDSNDNELKRMWKEAVVF